MEVRKSLTFGANVDRRANQLFAALHEEWRLVLFVLFFGAVCALTILFPYTTIYMASFAGVVLLYSLRYQGAKTFLTGLGVTVLVASALSSIRVTSFEKLDFEPEQYVKVTGKVDRLDIRPEKATTLILQVDKMSGLFSERVPRRIRLAVRTEIARDIHIGSTIQLAAIISPVGGALVPGGYDFGRAARFQGIEARGYAASDLLSTGPVLGGDLKTKLNELRYLMAARIQKAIPGQPGALAVALTLGLRHGIDDKTSETLRRAGLSHLLAISGLHMGIVAAVGFFLFELIFAAVPAIALRVMPRKLAVAPAWLLAAGYLLLSGGSISTIRAFIMVSVAMLAVLSSRRVLSLRSVALAAFAILILQPEAVLTIGFQMSFAATTGLIAFYERYRYSPIASKSGNDPPLWRKAASGLVMIGITSMVAQVSVAPFALYHFQALSVIGIVANMLVLPIISFLVMPLLMLTIFLAAVSAVSLLGWLLHPLLSLIIVVADAASSPSFAVFRSEPMSEISFLLLLTSFLVLVLVRHRFGLNLAAALLTLGLLLFRAGSADLLISRTGSVIAENGQQGVSVQGGRNSSFRTRSWRRYWGEDPFQPSSPLPVVGTAMAKRFELEGGHYVYLTKTLSAVRPSCASEAIVIIPAKYVRYCKGASLIITQEALKKHGPAGIVNIDAVQPRLIWANPPKP